MWGLTAPRGFESRSLRQFACECGPFEPVSRSYTHSYSAQNRILVMPAARERIVSLGREPAPMTPEQFEAKAREDANRFGKIIREHRIMGD